MQKSLNPASPSPDADGATVENRILELLERILDERCTPEMACTEFPDLLPVVKERWRRLQSVEQQVGLFFPSSISVADDGTVPNAPLDASRLPQIEGYDVQAVLGRGGMGVVFRARHLKLNRTVALKMLLSGAYAGPHELVRFQREAEAVAGLNHPNIVQVFDVGELNGRPYFTMEFVAGGSLAESLAGTPQPAQRAALLTATLARAVEVAHAGRIVHRDLKPANVLLTADGNPKISDFGLARRFEGDSNLTRSGARIGTPSYMAPEQAAGKSGAAGPAADVYALGAILYEMLTGRPPFRAETAVETERQVIAEDPVAPSRLNAKVPRDLETICLKCLHKDPQRRYPTAQALAEDLQRFQRGEPVTARRASLVERLGKWINRHRSLAAVVAGGVLLSIALPMVAMWVILERSVVVRAVEDDLNHVVQAQQRSAWPEARAALEQARARLGDVDDQALRRKISQHERELEFVTTLDRIRLRWMETEQARAKYVRADAAYEAAFGEAGLFDLKDETRVAAEKIRSIGIASAIVMALDDWSACTPSPARQEWVLQVAGQVDQYESSLKFRDIRLWKDKDALQAFLKEAPIEDQSVSLMIMISERLQALGGDVLPMLQRLQRAHPDEFWANLKLANALHARKNPTEAIRYFQAAIAVRPDAAIPYGNLGTALGDVGRFEEALEQCRSALRIDPDSLIFRYNAGLALYKLDRHGDAIQELRPILDRDPRSARTLSLIGHCLSALNLLAEAIEEHRRAIELEPDRWEAHRGLRIALLKLDRPEQARVAWQRALALNPADHAAWDGYAELCLYLGQDDEYRRARQALLKRFGDSSDPIIAERTGRACLFLPANDDELRQISGLIDRAVSADRTKYRPYFHYFRFAKGLAEYRAGRQESALAHLEGDTLKVLGPAPRLVLAMVQHRLGQTGAARQSYETAVAQFDWKKADVGSRETWIYHILRREAEKLVFPDAPTPLERK